jgi:hypothetical protein
MHLDPISGHKLTARAIKGCKISGKSTAERKVGGNEVCNKKIKLVLRSVQAATL